MLTPITCKVVPWTTARFTKIAVPTIDRTSPHPWVSKLASSSGGDSGADVLGGSSAGLRIEFMEFVEFQQARRCCGT
ncbi:MAG: hypothetical protein WCP23_12770 [Planctomycetota bacterium]